jgi:Icc-related predicted phosphoesterase
MKLKLWAISDTHSYHNLLQVPECDIVIFSGDSTNYHDRTTNYQEFENFLFWFDSLKITHKIMIAGNHDATLFYNTFNIKSKIKDKGIIYLENDYVEIEGLTIFGSPITPTFNDWYFMKSRDKMDKFWSNVEPVDIMVTHGPPKYILDLTENKEHKLEFCGDKALYRHVVDRIKPSLHLFGHIHNFQGIENSGIKKIMNCDTIFSNGAVVEDGKFGNLIGNGNLFEIDTVTKKVNIL